MFERLPCLRLVLVALAVDFILYLLVKLIHVYFVLVSSVLVGSVLVGSVLVSSVLVSSVLVGFAVDDFMLLSNYKLLIVNS